MSNPYQPPIKQPTERRPNAIHQVGFLYIAVLVILTLLCLGFVVSTFFYATLEVSSPAETKTVPSLQPESEVRE